MIMIASTTQRICFMPVYLTHTHNPYQVRKFPASVL